MAHTVLTGIGQDEGDPIERQLLLEIKSNPSHSAQKLRQGLTKTLGLQIAQSRCCSKHTFGPKVSITYKLRSLADEPFLESLWPT